MLSPKQKKSITAVIVLVLAALMVLGMVLTPLLSRMYLCSKNTVSVM